MEPVILSDGTTLATWRTGDEAADDRPPVVLLHGGPGLWDYLAPLAGLIEGRVVYRYDQRGCGRSSASDEQSIARSVRDLDELRGRWGADRLVVVGHSDRTAAVAHVSGVGIGDWHAPYEAGKAARQAAWSARLAELAGRERAWDEEVEWRRLQWAPDYADPVAGLEHARAMAETRLPINVRANRTLRFTDADVLGWAASIACPVLVLHGSADIRPAACAAALADHLPDVRVRILDGAGHLPWVERPEETAAALRELLG